MATQTYVAGTGGGSSTTITIDVSGETFASGDQIVVFAGADSADSVDASVSDDGSNSYTNLQSSSSADPGLNLWVATLDGTETTVTVTTTTSGPNWSGAAVILRGYSSIVGGDVTTTLGGGGDMPDPPAGTAEASDDVLVIGALEDDVTDPITAPAGYTMLGFGNLGSSGSGCDIMAAIRETVSAGSENPSAFGGGGDNGWAAATIILTPTGGGPEPDPAAMKVQHISDDVTNSGGTNTSFTEVASLSYAVELANNNRMTHHGVTTSNNEGDDMAGGRVLTAVDTLTYYRESGSDTSAANFRTSIWEYTGAVGGPNEFVVLGRVAVTLNGSTRTYASASGFTAPTDRDAVVPFITGIMNDDTGDGADSGTAIAWIDSSDRLNVEKGTTSNNVTVYVTLVEFTGSNWTVLHGDSGDFSADSGTFDLYAASDFTGSVTAVTDQADSLIVSGFRGDTAATGTNEAIADHWPLVQFTDNDTLNWAFDSQHDSDGTNRVVAHVIENSEWAVTRYTASDSGPLETTFDITSSGLTDLTQAIVVGHSESSGTGTAYARGWRNYYFNSLTEVGASCIRTGNGMTHVIQVVDMTAMSAGSSGITGTAAASLPAITSAATGSITRSGSAAATLPSISASSAGVIARSATASATLASATASASGDIAAGSSGTAAATMPPATATASGQRVITGAASAALGPITASAAGVRSVTGAAATVAPVPTAAAAGSITANLTATASITAPGAQASGAGVVNPIQDETGNTLLDESGEGIWGTEDVPPITGAVAAQLFAPTASATGTRGIVGSSAAIVPLPIVEAVGDSNLSGQVSANIPAATASATGQMARSGTVDATLPGLEASAAGGFVLDGAADATLPTTQVAASGVVAQIVGQVAATLPVPDLASQTAFTRKAAVAATIPVARADVLAGLQIFGIVSATLPAARSSSRDRAFRRVDFLDLWIQNGPDDVGGEALVSPITSRNDLSIYGGAYVRALLDQSGLTLQDESDDDLTHVEQGKAAGAVVDLDRSAANRAEIDQRGANIARTVGGPTLVDV